MPPDEMFRLFSGMSDGDIEDMKRAYREGSTALYTVAREYREEHALTGGQRALAASRLVALSKWKRDAAARAKTKWMLKARAAFAPGDRRPCAVCGGYQSLTEAHHIFPLAEQYAAGVAQPIQEYAWLCPTHHRAAHVMVTKLLANRQYSFPGMPAQEVDTLDLLIGARFVQLWVPTLSEAA